MATFVLVHGAWHGGWCWQKVIPFLEEAGHEVYAPTLTGLAERASELSPDVGLDTHIQDIVGLLTEKNLHGVILVGHSYGAMVITGVVDQVPERIAHLVYLDTFVPRDGESMADSSPMVIRLLRKQAQAHGDGWRVDSHGTYGVTTEPDRSMVRRSVTPQPLKTLEQPLHLKNPAIVSAKPRTHIDCTGSGFFFSLMRHLVARRALPPTEAGWRLRQLPTGHDAMITMPRELADLLLEVV
ncbi:MAG TPA: alpha/beta fold hydrolase [Ktedonobacteraceae bacterium]|nr:alpha/beta fold hydrolase [Ktedonobacteraceae bacterium]